MNDPTENTRRELVAKINNAVQTNREAMEEKYGQVWDTNEMTTDYSVCGFAAPFIVVHRRSDGVKGSLTFQHYPRFYFDFHPEEGE